MLETPRCDLHVHSRYSTDSGNFALRRARLGESYTEPERVYRVCRQRGMTFVTISDHNTVEGALRIAHLDGTFLSEEVTTRFAGEEIPLHVLVWDLTEEDHRDLQPYRPSVVELVAFLRERSLQHALAHPLYRMGQPLTPAHVEQLTRLFAVWEGRNGARPEETNALASRIAMAAGLALTGGSDDHGALDIATTWTEAAGRTPAEFLAAVRAGRCTPGGAHGSAVKLAHAIGALAVNAYRAGGYGSWPAPVAEIARLLDEDADDAAVRHAEIRTATRTLTRISGSRVREGGVDLGHLDAVGSRLASLAAAAALQAPYLGTAHHHAEARSSLGELEQAFFDEPEGDSEIQGLVFTDTFDEANGVAGTMRRLAAESRRGRLPLRVATARAEAAEQAGLIALPDDWRLRLPAYEQLELRFPLLTDVVELVERERPDVVHVATPGPVGVSGLLAAKLLGVPTVGSYHTELGPYTLHLTRDLVAAQAMDIWVDWFYKHCDVVLAPTGGVADALRGRGYRDVRLWGRGVDADQFAPRRRSSLLRDYLLDGGSLLFLSVGRLSVEKRIGILLEAFARVHERAPETRLVIVGDGPARAELEAAAPDGVRFLGELRDDGLAQVFASSDVFCFPSTTDTFGQVLLEAAASGLAVVAAAAGGALELVEHGSTGLLVAPDDPVALADALDELVEDPPLRLALSRRGLAAAQRRSWDAAHAQLLAAYAELVGLPRPVAQIAA
jgi:glycosyltransferase involved in cell wall biosynthesis/predicted metal-dependent phosphoesterase TrpH